MTTLDAESSASIERELGKAVAQATAAPCSPVLANAIAYAVFPGGGRLRPRLCVEVARACGNNDPKLAVCAGAAIELLHCASLAQDDLPCFDNADERRGLPSLHRRFGEATAVLVGDALIIMAFDLVARHVTSQPREAGAILLALARAAGTPVGLVTGQAWESEPTADVDDYHQAKTGALFEAATVAGAIAGGGEPEAWRSLGSLIGHAYQVADDLADATGNVKVLGKPVGNDLSLGRPNAVTKLGLPGAVAHLDNLITRALDALPQDAQRDRLVALLNHLCNRLRPPETPPAGPPLVDQRTVEGPHVQ